MDKEKHQEVLYLTSEGKAQQKVNDPRFRKLDDVTDELFELEMAKKTISLDLPVQLGYHILQLAKLRMLQFYYDFMCKFCDARDFEYLEMDTDSAYMAVSGKTLRDIIKPEKLMEYDHELKGHCTNEAYDAENHFFPRECCAVHRKHDKRTPGLFKLEAEGNSMIALCSKTYALKQQDGSCKISTKGINR